MQEYSIEERYIIDQQIKKLSEEEAIYFKTYYKKPKNEYALVALIILLGVFGGPFFYIKNKYITPDIIMLAVINFVLVFLLQVIYVTVAIFGSGLLLFSIFLPLVYMGGMYIIYYRNYEKFKNAIDFYNYNEKVKILKEIIK